MGCTGCEGMDLGRRRFVTQLLLVAASAWVAEACGDGSIGGPGGPDVAPPVPGGNLVVTLANFPALATVGGIARVDGNSATPIAVARLGASNFVALSLVCPHAGFKPVGIEVGGFECPNHGAQFDIDGTWIGGQPTRNMLEYAVTYDADVGTLTIG